VWLLTNNTAARSVLEAFDATNVTMPIYTSEQAAGSRDAFGNYVKFTSPVISNGHVFAATTNSLAVFGELPPVTAQLTSAPTLTKAGSAYTFSVTYHSSAGGFNAAAFGSDDISITTPKFSAAAQVVSIKAGKHASTQTVTYSVQGPGGAWDNADKGTYTVQMNGGAVMDRLGNFAQPGALGTFSVQIA
jgi:hypothetical protein